MPSIFYSEGMMKTEQNRREQPLRLLIVDGVTHTRRNLASFLQLQENLSVVGETAVAAEAICLAQQLQPDIVIMDINLPDMDGFTAAQQIVALDCAPSVLLVTLRLHPHDLKKAKEAGAVACIEKSAGVDAILFALVKN
jgi:DNA-binding NarL/FixJ family response regulator